MQHRTQTCGHREVKTHLDKFVELELKFIVQSDVTSYTLNSETTSLFVHQTNHSSSERRSVSSQ